MIDTYGLTDGRHLQFVCEPTGGLQYKLQLMAERYGANLAFVDTERMYNARMITYGNSEKTDQKDPGAMRNLYLIGRHRPAARRELLQETVRCLSREYEDLSVQAIAARNRIHSLLGYVFVDYHKPASFTFSRSGQALAKEFGFCPHLILQVGQSEFIRRLKAHVRRMRRTTIAQLWAMAERSVAAAPIPDPRLEHLIELYERWMWLEERKGVLKERLKHYGQLFTQRGWMPRHLPPSVSHWMLVRVIVETGSLEHFSHIRQLWAYLGLKLACRQSGKYKGQIKITKKGSSLARKLLYQICLPLVKSTGWMHASYKKQNPTGKKGGEGIRAMTCLMRKLVLALYQSGDRFEPARLVHCESQYH